MARPNVAQSRPQDWAYLAEGGSTIVFSYAGPSHPSFTGKVLRLRKAPLADALRDKTTDEEDDDPAIAFQKTVIAALVPSRYLPDLDVVLLDPGWLAELQALRNRDRPAERREKDEVDCARKKGVLATDLIGGGTDVLAVEVKPKWGFIPSPAHLSQETAAIKTSTCRFCMHTHFKFRDGHPPTQYCPLDFFSTDEARTRKAIRDLWNGWVQSDGALNNLRLFVSGKTIRPFESRARLGQFLSPGTETYEALATALLPALRDPILGIVSNLQRSLDPLDIEGITKLYVRAHPDATAIERTISVGQLQDFVASYHRVYRTLDHSNPRPEHIDTYLAAYLLSATFKDCSVIFRIRRSDISGPPSPDVISLIDLDLKSADRFEAWASLDKRIVAHYRDTAQRKRCVE